MADIFEQEQKYYSIDLKLSLLTQQKLLEEFLRDCQWVNAYIQSSQVNVMQTRRHLRRCPVKGQAFVDWFNQQRNAFDTQALKEYGWLKMNAFIDGCLHVVPSSGQQFPFTDHFKGAVVLETIDFSVSDLSKFGKDDPIPHGLLQVTVMPAPLQKNAICCRSNKWHNLQIGSRTCCRVWSSS